MADEERGFVIRDRRARDTGTGNDSPPASTPRQSQQAQQASQTEQAPPAPPINFLSFVYSMGTSALMLLGEKPEGMAGPAPNLAHAQEIIDILTMMETKTKGNLTGEEETLLQEMLYTLRIKYVEKASSPKL